MKLNDILEKGVALVFMNGETEDNKQPTGMVISCSSILYHVYFQVNGEDDFEFVNSYPVKDYVPTQEPEDRFENILEGAYKLAEAIETGETEL